jgi:hypothetical protein
MSPVEMPATLTAFGSPPTPATAKVLVQTPGDRFVRMATGFGAGAGLALISVVIPVAHFILVPAFLATGIGLAVTRAREDTRLLGLHGTCPRCGAEQDFTVSGRFTAARSLDCPKCHTNLSLDAGPRASNTAA